jgi:hypothetical protein
MSDNRGKSQQPPDDDEAALRWLITQTVPGQWVKMQAALKCLQDTGGFGRMVFQVKDGKISGHVEARHSL